MSEQLGMFDEGVDRNADLVGYRILCDGGVVLTVTGTAPWNPAYMLVEGAGVSSCRAAGLLRARLTR